MQSPQTLRENVLGLLKEGQDPTQIATDLNVPISKVRYWRRYHLNRSRPLRDGRRLYDDQFKRDVLNQIASGISILKLSRSLEVSRVTLFKWKREWRQTQIEEKEATELALPIESDQDESNQDESLDEKDLLFSAGQVETLLERIRVLEEEKDILTKALRIVIGTV